VTAPIVEYKGMCWNPEETVTYPKILNCTMAIDRLWKLLQRGKTTLNFHRNSVRYSPEAVLSVYSRDLPKREPRADNNNWNRMELPFPISSVTRDFFFECSSAVDARLKGL